MNKIMFDSNIYDKLPSIIKKINNGSDLYDFYITTIQIEELSGIPDKKKEIRENNILMLAMLHPKIIPLHTAIYGKCRYGMATYGEGIVYDELLKETKNNINDALIADTAVFNNCILVTDDKELYRKMQYKNYKVMNYEEFILTLK